MRMKWKLKTTRKKRRNNKRISSSCAQETMEPTKSKEPLNQRTRNYFSKSRMENRKKCFLEKI
jgi:hypothetical protein